MAGIFGIVGHSECIDDLFLGTFYLQHRAQNYCGLKTIQGRKTYGDTHRGLVKTGFNQESLNEMKGNSGIGVVSVERQPVSELSKGGGFFLALDGNIINHTRIKNKLRKQGASFTGFYDPEKVQDTALIAKIIAKEGSFEKGLERIAEEVQGDFSIIALYSDRMYAARGWGRKPLVIGKKDGSYAVSSESNSFINTGIKLIRDVEPGEIVLIQKNEYYSIKHLDINHEKYGTFEWIYTAYPASTIDGRNVAEVRKEIGKLLAKRYPIDADIISPTPNSGRWHAIGYAKESGIPYEEAFTRYDYSDRSFTPGDQQARDLEARTKLIPMAKIVEGKRIVLVDDSIVRGTQFMNRVKQLKEAGAKEVHARIACPPLMSACCYGKTTRRDDECIARRMNLEQIQEEMKLDSLGYATIEDLEQAIGYSREELCLECWSR